MSTVDTTNHWALGIEYDGSRFAGWQRQSGVETVQQALETALGRIAGCPIETTATGRTDAGVHATGQVVGFQTRADRSAEAWLRGTQSVVAPGIAVVWAERVSDTFHARFSATSRRYQYLWLPADRPPGWGGAHVTWVREALSATAMPHAAPVLLGEHDFSSFRAASCQSHTPFRCVHAIAVRQVGDFVVLDITANAFLHHMVRNIAEALRQIGAGQRDAVWLRELLAAKDRTRAPKTAPPNGLYLVEVRYGALELPRGRRPLLLRAAPETE